MEIENPDLLGHSHPAKDLPQKVWRCQGEICGGQTSHGGHRRKADENLLRLPLAGAPPQAISNQHEDHARQEIEPQPCITSSKEFANTCTDLTELADARNGGSRGQISEESKVDRIRPQQEGGARHEPPTRPSAESFRQRPGNECEDGRPGHDQHPPGGRGAGSGLREHDGLFDLSLIHI